MMDLSNDMVVSPESICNGSLLIKGSVHKKRLVYLVYGVSKNHSIPILISSYPAFDEAKEVISQITLAMDKI